MTTTKTILVVDDNPLQAIMLRRVLIQAEFEVTTAKNGQEALDYLKKAPFSLVISDINMPVMNGFELCKLIKSDPTLRHIPVILCTMLSDSKDLIKGIEVCADNYITRPWIDERLIALARDLMNVYPKVNKSMELEEVSFAGEKYVITTNKQHILNFLLTTYENIHQQNIELNLLRQELQKTYGKLKNAQDEQEQIILNIFPEKVAQELIAYGSTVPARYENVTVGFIDFVGFTKSSMRLSPHQLIEILEFYFENFDRIIEQRGLERIKTIGDGYLYVGGISQPSETHAYQCVMAALEIRDFIRKFQDSMKQKYGIEWSARFGLNTGPIIAGVIGKKRLAYDIWGETVNVASKLESNSEKDKINVSQSTYEKVKDFFVCTPRGAIALWDAEELQKIYLEMYFIESVKV